VDIATIITRLHEHHAEIEHCLREGKLLLLGGDACRLKAMGLVRWRLMRSLRAYRLFKHGELFDPLLAATTGPHWVQAVELKRRCIVLAEDYADYVARWTQTNALRAWPDYLLAAEAMVARIRRHLAEEAAGIERLVHALPAAAGPHGADRPRQASLAEP